MRKLKNNSGMILLGVILIIVSLSILTLTVLGHNVSQASTDQYKIDKIKAQAMAQGTYARQYARMANYGTYTPSSTPTYANMDGKTYSADMTATGGGSPTQYDIAVTY